MKFARVSTNPCDYAWTQSLAVRLCSLLTAQGTCYWWKVVELGRGAQQGLNLPGMLWVLGGLLKAPEGVIFQSLP